MNPTLDLPAAGDAIGTYRLIGRRIERPTQLPHGSSLGFNVAEAVDTSRRGTGLDWGG